MCDPVPLKKRLVEISVAIGAAVGLIGAAIAANASVFAAWTAPGILGAAAIATASAELLCVKATSDLKKIKSCAGSRCLNDVNSMGNILLAARLALSVQVGCCAIAVWVGWAVGAAIPYMTGIAAALGVQAALIMTAIDSYKRLAACVLDISVANNAKFQILYVEKAKHSDPTRRISSVGGRVGGQEWRFSLDKAILVLESGWLFCVEQPKGHRVHVEVGKSRKGNKYLKTIADGDIPNNLLSLPDFPNR